ncbi:MAG: Pr6Pr family membrane protein [Actinomycetota bacterium]|nr:Pr6Pr family membrane protein [Actinomycetota bacterium]
MAPKSARVWFGATAACVLAGVVIALITAANKNRGHFHPAAARAANEFAFFTIQSNLLVGLATLLLAVRLDRSSTAFAILRLSGLVAIIFTGVGFYAGFSPLHLKGWNTVWNELLHTVVPMMTVLGWLLIGPRRIVSRRVAWLSVIFPVGWLAFTLIRGAIVHWYPYPFIDVTQLGYGRTALNCFPIPLSTLCLAAGATVLDGRLARATSRAGPVSADSPS